MPAIDAAAYRSPWRRLHPAVKGVLFGGLLVCALVLPAWPAAPLAAAAAVGAVLGPARVAPRAYAGAVWGPLLFVLTGAAALLVSVGGPGGAVAMAADGGARAAEVAGRAAAAVCCQVGFACTTPLAEVLPRLTRAGVPEPVVEVVALVYRMLFVALEGVRRIQAAQAARLGYSGWRPWIRSAGALGAALFVRSYDRSRRLQRGLECRGYTGALTVLVEETPLRPAALAAAAAPALLVAAVALGPSALGAAL
ncbi:cobalt ECF transporter T component CbiQ [Streptomonospora nanhaiensis]|uniref:Cobalt/nickel transport system permease protein n=1 Tax=Streptomonospora nanhaiensis TaxID=1323731 RepID=A0A853BTZ8_9ACTN|nr:cobalt ECF transporter T component CbiQ [Streptomonospora nanhaiensis]MBV2365489.1 cobalt ECF transporter T component CbiQ [Streptomonospora nanhaiensis]MBX9390813.1 cobalt ECF transporter T component CbiQ [Streptomonospora nanhaiensis]NYI98434.1 cobalt/nickel transport system permease protein [Streptomonospora nanhaiensis]